MFSENLLQNIKAIDNLFLNKNSIDYQCPQYDPQKHYLDLTSSGYYRALIAIRQVVSMTCDYYLSEICHASKVDLFMITPSISSPMGPGSNSTALAIKFGKYNSFLTDSAQFGFEPLMMNSIDKAYCYMPSIRGEDPDYRHLNQFFHCEAEIVGFLSEVMKMVEGLIKILCYSLVQMPNIINLISRHPDITLLNLQKISLESSFKKINFEEALDLLNKAGLSNCIKQYDSGRDLTSEGEKFLGRIFSHDCPFWLVGFDRDRVPFYHKPEKYNSNKVLACDLLFTQLTDNSFGGEIVGAGERQDNVDDLVESLNRQGIEKISYEWYINLRKLPTYKTTSGFGLGIERFLTWALCRLDIKETVIYPRLKNIKTYP